MRTHTHTLRHELITLASLSRMEHRLLIEPSLVPAFLFFISLSLSFLKRVRRVPIVNLSPSVILSFLRSSLQCTVLCVYIGMILISVRGGVWAQRRTSSVSLAGRPTFQGRRFDRARSRGTREMIGRWLKDKIVDIFGEAKLLIPFFFFILFQDSEAINVQFLTQYGGRKTVFPNPRAG